MLLSLLTFTGSQKSLSQHTQVQQHHMNITAGPSAALAPVLGPAYPAASICQAERALPVPEPASLCAGLGAAAANQQCCSECPGGLCTFLRWGAAAAGAGKGRDCGI